MGVFLAPMAGVTDLPFRILSREHGAELVVSEMVSAQALVYDNQKTLQMLALADSERPTAIQIFGHDPKTCAQAARIVFEIASPEMIDLNFGCPTPKVVKNGDGAALLKNVSLLGQITTEVVNAVPIPVTAKIRLGWDSDSINCLEVAKILEDAGAYWITVHARTREQYYSGQAHWEWIGKVKSASGIPIVGNGDVSSPRDARRLLDHTKCDHVAIGRGAQGNPWIFGQIRAYLERGVVLADPTLEERIDLAIRHLRMKVDFEGEVRAVREMRPHLAWYLKGVPHSAEARREINLTTTVGGLERLLKEFL